MLIKTPDGKEIKGSHPIVILGPNGSGKTTYGASLASKNNAELILATRNLQFSDSISMQPSEQASKEVKNQKNTQKQQPWIQSNELNQLLIQFKAEEAQISIDYRRKIIGGKKEPPPLIKIDQLTDIWSSIFPKRDLNFSSYTPRVKARHKKNPDPFGISKMSGGERVGLYLLARILDAPPGLIIIDEPEIHFHRILAKKFWNYLEIFRNDCRFIYITHDLPFAISRNNVQFIHVLSESEQKIFPPKTNIPDEVVEAVIGAATFSISAKRIIFCEGSKNNNREDEIYSAWLESENVAVVPVGNSDEVVKATRVFNNNAAIKGVKAVGIIDRDYRSEKFLSRPPKNINVLGVHEIESLFCLEGVFLAIGKHLKISKKKREEGYSQFISEIKDYFKRRLKERNKIILERVKNCTQDQLRKSSLKVKSKEDVNEMKRDYLNSLEITNWTLSPPEIFKQEEERLENALKDRASVEKLLEIVPGKTLFGKAMKKLKTNKNDGVKLIISALSSDSKDKNNPFKVLKRELRSALKKYKPAAFEK